MEATGPDIVFLKEGASAVAFALTFLLFAGYIRSIHRGQTVPHAFSWMVWTFGTFVVFAAQLAGGAGIGAWPIGLSACITGYVAFLAWRVRADVRIDGPDWVLFTLAVLALPAWALAADPLWAVVFLTTADLLGFGPTLRKAYVRPFEEPPGFFALGALRNGFVIVALEHYSWTTALFPAAVGLGCLLLALFIVLRRMVMSRADAEAPRGIEP
ncbi:MAG: hypothetical protein AAGE43_01585 [Pseudomonadota bacterium]